MYDELVKRLRSEAVYLPEKFSKNAELLDVLMKAANAIEELSKKYLASEVDNTNLTGWLAEEHAKHLWIPVTERLPEEDGRYLTLYPLKTKPSVWRHKVYGFAKDLVEVDKYEFNEHKPGFYGYDDEYGYYEDKDVTHWMPLPEPPKGDGAE